MATLFRLCLFARMRSDQWQSYFLCRGQGPVYFRQSETEGGVKKARLTERSRPQKAAAPPLSPPRLVSYSQSVDSGIHFESSRMLCVTHITCRDNYIAVRLQRATCCPASL